MTPRARSRPRLWPGEGADTYAEEARRTAELVAERVPEIPKWWFAFQSQGASGGPWIGPTVEETLTVIAEEGVKTLLLQPIGFLCDHVEILYDVDIAFKEYAAELGHSPGAAGVVECFAYIGARNCRTCETWARSVTRINVLDHLN